MVALDKRHATLRATFQAGRRQHPVTIHLPWALILAVLGLLALASCARAASRADFPATLAPPQDLDELAAALKPAVGSVRTSEGSVELGEEFVGAELIAGEESLLVFEVPAGPAQDRLHRLVQADFGRVTTWRTAHLLIAYPGQQGGTILVLSGLVGDPVRLEEPAQDEPFPPAVAAAIAYVAAEKSVHPAQVDVLSFHEQEWPDACLGLSRNGETCVGEGVQGWAILLSLGGQSMEVHTDQVGLQVRMAPSPSDS